MTKGIPGKIIEEPFRDFGYNRSFALKACESIPNMDYILLLDADMVLKGPMLENPSEFKKGLTADVYHMCQGTATFFYKNVRIVKNYKGYSYWGVTHEFVQTPNGTQYEYLDRSQIFIEDIGDGGAKSDKFERDIRLLLKGLEDNPNNDRYTFYLANSYRDHGDHDFIGARCIVDTCLHRIKVAAHKGCVFVAQGHINCSSQCALLFGGRHQRCTLAHRFAQRCTQLGMKNGGGVFQLTRLAHDGGFAIAVSVFRLYA